MGLYATLGLLVLLALSGVVLLWFHGRRSTRADQFPAETWDSYMQGRENEDKSLEVLEDISSGEEGIAPEHTLDKTYSLPGEVVSQGEKLDLSAPGSIRHKEEGISDRLNAIRFDADVTSESKELPMGMEDRKDSVETGCTMPLSDGQVSPWDGLSAPVRIGFQRTVAQLVGITLAGEDVSEGAGLSKRSFLRWEEAREVIADAEEVAELSIPHEQRQGDVAEESEFSKVSDSDEGAEENTAEKPFLGLASVSDEPIGQSSTELPSRDRSTVPMGEGSFPSELPTPSDVESEFIRKDSKDSEDQLLPEHEEEETQTKELSPNTMMPGGIEEQSEAPFLNNETEEMPLNEPTLFLNEEAAKTIPDTLRSVVDRSKGDAKEGHFGETESSSFGKKETENQPTLFSEAPELFGNEDSVKAEFSEPVESFGSAENTELGFLDREEPPDEEPDTVMLLEDEETPPSDKASTEELGTLSAQKDEINTTEKAEKDTETFDAVGEDEIESQDVFSILERERGDIEDEEERRPLGHAGLYESFPDFQQASETDTDAGMQLPKEEIVPASLNESPGEEPDGTLLDEENESGERKSTLPPSFSVPASLRERLPEAEEPPHSPPADLIRSLVVNSCPGDLILLEAADHALPSWATGAVEAAKSDLQERRATRKPIEPEEFLRLAIVENLLGRAEDATVHLKDALRRASRLAPVLNALAIACYARGKIDPAVAYCKEGLREAGGDASARSAISRNLSFFCQLKGDLRQAAIALETAIECMSSQDEPNQLSRLHLRVGQLYRRLGQAAKAREHLSESVRLFQGVGDETEHARALIALASAQTESETYEVALRNLEEAARICQELGDKTGEALAFGQMGVTYTAQDQFTRALTHYENALTLHRELGNRKGEAANLSNIGNIHYFRGDLDEALEAYEAALEINREQGHEIGQGTSLGNLGRLHLEMGDREKARERLHEAVLLFRKAGAAEQLASLERILEELNAEEPD